MLKYVIVLFVIYVFFSDAHKNRFAGKYDELILAQNPPLVAFLNEYKVWPNENNSLSQSGLDEEIFTLLFKQTNWIVHGLWPHKISGASPTFCRRGPNRIESYNPEVLDPYFNDLLKTKWPDLTPNRTKRSIWNAAWIKHGSCVTDNENMNTIRKYFDKTVELSNVYNIGSILERKNIIPGDSYMLNKITDVLTDYLKKKSYIRCLPLTSSEKQEQYLLEVQICFNKSLDLVNCHRFGNYICNPNMTVIYPKI